MSKQSKSDIINYTVTLDIMFELRTGGPDSEEEIEGYIQSGINGFERDAFCLIINDRAVRL